MFNGFLDLDRPLDLCSSRISKVSSTWKEFRDLNPATVQVLVLMDTSPGSENMMFDDVWPKLKKECKNNCETNWFLDLFGSQRGHTQGGGNNLLHILHHCRRWKSQKELNSFLWEIRVNILKKLKKVRFTTLSSSCSVDLNSFRFASPHQPMLDLTRSRQPGGLFQIWLKFLYTVCRQEFDGDVPRLWNLDFGWSWYQKRIFLT